MAISFWQRGVAIGTFNQGSMRTNSVMSYILMSLVQPSYPVRKLETYESNKVVDEPLELERSEIFGVIFDKIRIDDMMIHGELDFGAKGWRSYREYRTGSDRSKFLYCCPAPRIIEKVGFKDKYKLKDRGSVDYYLAANEHKGLH